MSTPDVQPTAEPTSTPAALRLSIETGRGVFDDEPSQPTVLGRVAFRRAVQHERLMADRRGDGFALLMARVEGKAARDPDRVLDAARELARHVREGDLVGLRNRRTVGLLLHRCPAENARELAERVQARLQGLGLTASCRMLAYSDDGPSKLRLKHMLQRPTPPWKRALDLAVAGPLLVLALPVMAAVAAGIKLTDPGPVLFNQRRAGLSGRPFEIHKFRTMVIDAEARKAALRAQSEQDGPAFKITGDPRITRFGSFLRKTSLDELPQLWNVVKGDMSLVGPRPLPVDEQAGCSRWQSARLDVAPGLTCHWQVEGRSRVSFEEWMRMDLRYLNGRGPWRDLKILLATVPAVLLRKGSV